MNLLVKTMAFIKAVKRPSSSTSFVSARFLSSCSSGEPGIKKEAQKAKPRSDRLEEEVSGVQAVVQKAANILCGLSERTTTHKILHVGVEAGGDEGKTFSYFLGDSSTFDVSGVGEKSQELDAIKAQHNYSAVLPFTDDGNMPSEYRRNGYQYVVAISPSPTSHLISPETALEYTADGGYIIYGLSEQAWNDSGAMQSLTMMGDANKAQLMAVQIIEGFYLGLIRKA